MTPERLVELRAAIPDGSEEWSTSPDSPGVWSSSGAHVVAIHDRRNRHHFVAFDPKTCTELLDHIDVLEARLSDTQEQVIEARNHGINMDRVREDRAARRESEAAKYGVSVDALTEAEGIVSDLMHDRRAQVARLNDAQGLREAALRLAIESHGGKGGSTSQFIGRATKFEAYIRGETT